MSLWWLEPGWDKALCPRCGVRIWPEGDPDWGYCYNCFTENLQQQHREQQEYEQYVQEEREAERPEPDAADPATAPAAGSSDAAP